MLPSREVSNAIDPTFAVQQLYCPECGYDLRGIESPRCPECGQAIDRAALRQSQIPWVRRAEIGRIRAYWRTLWLVSLRPKRIATDIAAPAHLRDAELFRRVTVIIASLPLWAGVVVLYFLMFHSGHANPAVDSVDRIGRITEVALVPITCFAAALFLYLCSGVPSYFFHPKHLPIVQQNRAVALSYYGCAPLAFLPVALAIIVTSMLTYDTRGVAWRMTVVLIVVGYSTLLAVPAMCFSSTLALLRRTIQPDTPRVLAFTILVPLSWIVIFGATLFGIPAAVVWITWMILSRF